MDSLATVPEFNAEAYILQLPGGYGLLDMLVQANVDLSALTPDDVKQLNA